MSKRKKRNHYCWVCDQNLPNEKFSGRGHAKHICQTCAKLDDTELAYRQDVRNLERCVTDEGVVLRKKQAEFERFLQHEDPRIREIAEDIQQIDAESREFTCMHEAHKLVANTETDDKFPF